jgi:hypothetical protein
MFDWGGRRSAVAEDFRGEQTAALAGIVSRIGNCGLRARIADVAWSNDRRDGASAVAAINAYCEAVEGLLTGSIATYLGRQPQPEAIRLVHRALQIANATTKRAKRPDRVLTIFSTLYDTAREKIDIGTFREAAELALKFGLRKPADVALALETVAAAAPAGINPIAVKTTWDLAARLYQTMGLKDERHRCLIGAVDQTLAMRREVSTAAAEASWVMEALQQLRHIDGMENREQELEIELRRLQKAALRQMGSFEVDLKIGDTPEKVTEYFEKRTLSEALKQFALVDCSRDPIKLRAMALESRDASPLATMLSVAHLDEEGRTATKSAGAPHDGEADETWFRHTINQHERIHRARSVMAVIHPARLMIQARFGIEERHFNAIVGISAFVPEDQKPIMALGFTRFFQGDFMSSTHLLFPQLEPCLRHFLKLNGHDPSARRDDATEVDLSLSGLFNRFRTELDQILTLRIASEIDCLFNARPRPAFRHELAHGQISAAACFQPDTYYANWFIYHLCCLLVLPAWDELVKPQLEAGE